MHNVLSAFISRYPPAPLGAPSGGDQEDPVARLDGASGGVPDAEEALEEALLLWLANANPALERLRVLFDDGPLRAQSGYAQLMPLLEDELRQHGPASHDGKSLIDLLWAPQHRSPTSLEGQLRAAGELWAAVLDERYAGLLTRLLRSLDLLREERWRGPAGPGPAAVLDTPALHHPGEVEAFSQDSDWMPRVVLVAKNAHVWLVQLERRFQREVRRLDQVPDEALDELADHGFNALWLIGLWQRSEASRRIKRRRGQASALASAYALYDYVVAGDLGGEGALRQLTARAARRGIRLAGDMVPNHVGIDGKWVAEHPEWFVQLELPPYPSYRFDGPDLSSHPAMAVRIEDHYWDDSDAAVVFQRVDRASGEARYIYHGNDGTSMPWNDTAQLDYLKPEVREAVIQTILDVARRVPIIRFDAAMTLAKRHIQRLWYPPPGQGGAIPSRSAFGGMSEEDFERHIPAEFWREVVDRLALEAPGTLLLAEAFWMMEGYFVRTLGMHRVYNSAFMNMLKQERNAEYRQLLKDVLEFDPRILGRFVNFMNNPDEDTAIAQFGDGDKYFGVAVVMATMPGLPMFGHGQVEGFREKYGMEYRAPTFEETADPVMVERHRREVAPLLRRRDHFAVAETFRLYDVYGDDGTIEEDVYAYSNRSAGATSLVLFNNHYQRAAGVIHRSVPFAEPGAGGGLREEPLHQALGIAGGPERFTILHERLTGLEYLARSDEFRSGFRFTLEGFGTRVFMEVVEVRDEDGSYAGVHDQLAGGAVPDLEEARLDWLERLPRERFLALLDAAREGGEVEAAQRAFALAVRPRAGPAAAGQGGAAAAPRRPAAGAGRPRHGTDAACRGSERLRAVTEVERESAAERLSARPGTATEGAASLLPEAAAALRRAGVPAARAGAWGVATVVRAALALTVLDRGAEQYERRRLRSALESRLADEGVADPAAAARLPALLVRLLPLAGELPGAGRLLAELVADAAVCEFLGVHRYDGERWFRQERYRLLVAAVLGYAAARGASDAALAHLREAFEEAERSSGYRFDRLLADHRRTRGSRSQQGGGGDTGNTPAGEC